MGERNSYTKEQEILIIDLYTRTPTARIRDSNPEIIALCDFFNDNGYHSVVSGIRNKMENLKSVDPEYTADGRTGRNNIRQGFKELWLEELRSGFSELDKHVEWAVSEIVKHSPADAAGAMPVWRHRSGQANYRDRVLAAFDNSCCISGIQTPDLIQACHIKPYRICERDGMEEQKTDVRNGLCMSVLHHKAFDSGLITIDEEHRLLISSEWEDLADDDTFFRPYEGRRIRETSRTIIGEEYLEYHRENIFRSA